MGRHVALLRAINVGGRFVRMPVLVAAFESIGLTDVRSVIASGNLLFRSATRAQAPLARRIEGALLQALGYEVTTFLRSEAEWRALAQSEPPFAASLMTQAQALNVMFLADEPTLAQRDALGALVTPTDAFAVRGREIFWLCTTRQSESRFAAAVLERRLKLQTTLRTWQTVQKLAAALAID